MMRVRTLLFVGGFWLLSVPLAVLYTLFLPFPPSVMREGMRFWAGLVQFGLRVVIGIRVEVRGLEHRPTGAALIAAKHQSIYDTIAPFLFLPDACFVLKKELLKVPFYGWHAQKARMIPLDRNGHARALKELVATARARLEETRQIVIYPEGTRRSPGAPPDYKPGVAALYRDLGLACTPMATNSGVHWSAKGWPDKPGTIVFEFLPPIPPGLKRADFMRELEQRIEAASNRLLADGL